MRREIGIFAGVLFLVAASDGEGASGRVAPPRQGDGQETAPEQEARLRPVAALPKEGKGLLRSLRKGPDPRFAGRIRMPALVPPEATQGSPAGEVLAKLRDAASRALEANPSDVGGFADFQERLLWLGWADNAERAAEGLQSVASGFPPALSLLAAVRLHQGRLDESERLAAQALAASPDSYLALVCRGYARHGSGDWNGALADFERAAKLDPERPEAPFWHGSALFERNRIAEAARRLASVLPFEPAGGSGRATFCRAVAALAGELGERPAIRAPDGFRGLAATWVPRPDVPAVRVRLAGGIEGTMLVSTASSVTALYGRGTRAVRPLKGGSLPTSWVGPEQVPASPAVLEALWIEGEKFENVPVVAHADTVEQGDVLGVLGVSFLREFRAVLDGFEGALRLEPPGSAGRISFGIGNAPGPLSATFLPLRVVSGLPAFRGRVGKGPERLLLFDPAVGQTTVERRILEGELGLRAGAKGVETTHVSDPSGRTFHALRAKLPVPIGLGSLEFTGLTVRGMDLSPYASEARGEVAGILGFDVLRRSRVTLDFAAPQAMFEYVPP